MKGAIGDRRARRRADDGPVGRGPHEQLALGAPGLQRVEPDAAGHRAALLFGASVHKLPAALQGARWQGAMLGAGVVAQLARVLAVG
jgi:hypothetical protein